MSIIGSNILAGASGQGGGYTIENSLRLRSSASAYLSRTPATTTNQKTWTISAWFKRGKLGVRQQLVTVGAGAGTLYFYVHFNSTDTLEVNTYNSSTGSAAWALITTQVFRDPSAWYHIVVSTDTTQATASDRVKIYINGSQITAFNTATYPSLNYDTRYNLNLASYINSYLGTGSFFDGYTAEFNSIDGQALTPSSFGDYNEDTGVWQPVAYAGTYGTNGFYLPFSDATNTTTLVADSSGNGNDWTPNNISLTSGATYDSMTDTPTPYAGGGNYAVLNPAIRQYSTVDFASEGNLKYQVGANGGATDVIFATMPMTSGKWFAEVQIVTTATGQWIGVCSNVTAAGLGLYGAGVRNPGYAYRVSSGNKCNNSNTGTAYAVASTTGDIIGIAMDADAGSITFYKNGVSLGVAFTGMTNSGGGWLFGADSDPNGSFRFNFGQRPFAYTPPTGFLPLHTGNLPDSTIVDGSQYFEATPYVGDGNTTQTISGLEFQTDFAWVKRRSAAGSHVLQDVVRTFAGSTKLSSNSTNAEGAAGATAEAEGYVSGASSTGFTVTKGTGQQVNENGATYVAWNWKAGTAFSNDAGTNGATIASVGSVNQDAGFSVVTFTAPASGGFTFAHGLGVQPSMFILKDRTTTGTAWGVWHKSLANQAQSYLQLNSTNGVAANANIWNNTAPTSTVISTQAGQVIIGSANAVCYCFAEVEGYSKFGSYTGNGSADGTFVYLGFRPRFIMLKSTSSGYNWVIYDTARDTYNAASTQLAPNQSWSEATIGSSWLIDVLANGFKFRVANGDANSSVPYIYAAFAEHPFKNSLAR